MIYEIAHIVCKDGMQAQLEEGAAKAAPLFQRARGCLSFEFQRGIEQPTHYRLVVGWQTVDDHMVHFRNSPDFQAWRALVGHCFDGAPQVSHTQTVVKAF